MTFCMQQKVISTSCVVFLVSVCFPMRLLYFIPWMSESIMNVIDIVDCMIYNGALICIVYVIGCSFKKKKMHCIAVALCCVSLILSAINMAVQLNVNTVFLLNIFLLLMRIVAFLMMIGQLQGKLKGCIILLFVSTLSSFIWSIENLLGNLYGFNGVFFEATLILFWCTYFITQIIAPIRLLCYARRCCKFSDRTSKATLK